MIIYISRVFLVASDSLCSWAYPWMSDPLVFIYWDLEIQSNFCPAFGVPRLDLWLYKCWENVICTLSPAHTLHFLSIHLWTDPYIVSITLLLWMMLHWAWEYGQLLGILLHFIRINAHGQGYWKRREEVSVSSFKELLIDLLSNCVKLHLH